MISYSHDSVTEMTILALLTGKSLSSSKELRAFTHLLNDDTRESWVRSFLVLLAQKGERIAELEAAWKAIHLAEKSITTAQLKGAIDTCGTGGDSSHSINLSTLSSFVMAAAGVRVLKHGNRAITSRCGSSDLLESFGMNLNQKPNSVIGSAKEIGMGYFHAPSVHPIFAKFQKLRKGIHCRTLFNLLGPVLNPIAVDYQILGIAAPALLKQYAELLPRIGRKSALIILGAGGMDEVTTLGPSKGVWIKSNKVQTWHLNPREYGFKAGNRSELKIQSVAHSKQQSIALLKNKKNGTARDSVILGAACGIWLTGKSPTMLEGISMATHAIDSGKAWSLLNQMVKYSNL